MNTFTQFTRSGVLSVLVLFSGVAAQDLSDLDPTNPDSGLNAGVSNVIESLPQLNGPVLRPDDPTYISDPTGPELPAGARTHRITSCESGLWLVPIREEKARNLGSLCLYKEQFGGQKDQTWRFFPTPFGFRIVNADSGFSLVPIREEVRKNFGRLCLYNIHGPGARDQSWQFVNTRYGVRIVSAESGLSLVPIREEVRSNFGRLCLYNVTGEGVRDQSWNVNN